MQQHCPPVCQVLQEPASLQDGTGHEPRGLHALPLPRPDAERPCSGGYRSFSPAGKSTGNAEWRRPLYRRAATRAVASGRGVNVDDPEFQEAARRAREEGRARAEAARPYGVRAGGQGKADEWPKGAGKKGVNKGKGAKGGSKKGEGQKVEDKAGKGS